ncbi:MAG: glycine cleavage system protein GcvH [Deltaproteobacteria bacterium]|nr:glycine cleavage system protein GcvH [Deltaproteobacteria bacterium]
MIPTNLKYTKDHEWVRQEGAILTVGITDFAQEQLTDIVFVELPQVGRAVKAHEATCVLESVKSVADVYAPISGEVIEVNSALEGSPEKVNQSPYEEGWLFKLKVGGGVAVSGLMDAKAYEAYMADQH